jgi:AraC-like DNA-binding protein
MADCLKRGIKTYAGVGRPVARYTDVAESYEEAKTALHAAAHQARSTPVSFDDLPGSADGFALPPDVVSRLAQLVTRVAEAEGRALLSGLFHRNAAALQSDEHLERVLVSTLLGTLLAVRDRLALPPEPTAETVRAASELVVVCEDPNDAVEAILALFVALCESHRKTNSSANAALMDGVRSYLREHFPDKNLTLSAVAERFKISEYHLSRSFKARFGTTVYGFLEDVRISRAEELLADTDDPVRKIADTVGYGSSSSFCRSYRKRRGVSPTQFRHLRTIEQTGARHGTEGRV